MSTKALTVVLAAVAALSPMASAAAAAGPPPTVAPQADSGPPTKCCGGGNTGGPTTGGGAGGDQVVSWVLGATGGGVSQPAGTSSCTPWAREENYVAGTGPPGPNGVAMVLFVRVCDGSLVQSVWVPSLSPADLGNLAFDEVRKLVVAPKVALSPVQPAGGLVNFTTWLAVTPVAAVSATAGPLPDGLSATTTASVTAIRWDPGDGSPVVSCGPWGALPPADAPEDAQGPCSWTPHAPSAPQFSHTDDLLFHSSVSLVWAVAWTATNGAGGGLGSLTTTSAFTYRVREVQSIGEDR